MIPVSQDNGEGSLCGSNFCHALEESGIGCYRGRKGDGIENKGNGAREMTQAVQDLSWEHGALNLDIQYPHKK